MRDNYKEVKKTLYKGLTIFNMIKDYDLKINKDYIGLEDKKFLSLYLGIINTENKVSSYLKQNDIDLKSFVNVESYELSMEEYLRLYENYFVEIFYSLSFNSLETIFNYLLSKNIIQEFNQYNGYCIDFLKENNKKLIKI